MCGRFVQYSGPEVYASHVDLDEICEAKPRYNVAPTQHVLAVRLNENRRRELVPLRWSLIPAWSKGPDSRYSMINARAETADTKPAYRNAFKHRRCLIHAEGFYEWQKTGDGKQPHIIRRCDRAPFTMATKGRTWEAARRGRISFPLAAKERSTSQERGFGQRAEIHPNSGARRCKTGGRRGIISLSRRSFAEGPRGDHPSEFAYLAGR